MNTNDGSTESYTSTPTQRMNLIRGVGTSADGSVGDNQSESYTGSPVGKNRIIL